jgi:hypothetical protein
MATSDRVKTGRFHGFALSTALFLAAIATGARQAVAEGGAFAGEMPSGSRMESPAEAIDRMRRQQFGYSGTAWPNDSRFQPETAESIRRKLQSGEYTIDRNEKPWWYWAGKLSIAAVAIVMFIVTLVQRLTAKKPTQAEAAQTEARLADVLAESAAAKYKDLVGKLTRQNFLEQRPALAAEGAAAEQGFRQAALHYRAASDKLGPNGEGQNPVAHERAGVTAKAYLQRAAAQTAMADVVALVGDSSVTSAEEFARKAAPLMAAAKTAGENYSRMMKGNGRK